jgi:ABC-type nitrate/sulfonate/bicarbonate transport system permease component
MPRGGLRRETVAAFLRDVAIGLLGIAIAIAIWELAAEAMGRYFPAPLAVLDNALGNFAGSRYLRSLGLPEGGYLPHLLYTTRTVIVGVLAGFTLGLVSGFASWRWRVADEVIDPVISIFGTLPIIVAAPFFLIWFGLVAFAQIILVAFYTFMILHVFVLRAARNVDVKYIESARTLGAGGATIFRAVILPAALPEIFGGIRVAFASAWGLACIAELLGAQYGVGRVIVSLAAVYDVVGMMALVVLLGLIAVVLDGVIVAVRAYVTRWAQTGVGS